MAGPPASPPPWGPGGWPQGYGPVPQPRRSSGLALVSLICGIGNLVICVAAPLLAPLGLVLGVLALRERSGPGHAAGRGMAVAGVILNSVGLLVAGLVLFYFATQVYTAQANESVRQAAGVDADFYFIEERLRTYYRANGDSLGPGGPGVAGLGSRFAKPANSAPRVAGALRVADLVGAGEIQHPLGDFRLTVTGPRSAVVRHEPSGRELRILNLDKRVSSIHLGP